MSRMRRLGSRRRGTTGGPREDLSSESKSWWNQYCDSLKIHNSPHADSKFPPKTKPWKSTTPSQGTTLQLNEMETSLDQIMTYMGSPSKSSPFSTSSDMHGKRIQAVGGIQSGKTASMIGLAAKSLDAGFRIIIVLSGTKDLLRNQTASRFNQQLLCVNECIDGVWSHPSKDAIPNDTGRKFIGYKNHSFHPFEYKWATFIPSHVDIKSDKHRAHLVRCLQIIRDNQKANGVFVIKKHARVMEKISEELVSVFASQDLEKFPMLIIDDESDEQTCPKIDIMAEVALHQIIPPSTGKPTLMPITSERARELQYGADTIFQEMRGIEKEFPTCTVAYTATPQAPLLHNESFVITDSAGTIHPIDNPFRPTQAVIIKRPSDVNEPWSFAVPTSEAYDGWYTGQSMFSNSTDSMNERHPPRSIPGPPLSTGNDNPGKSILNSPITTIAPPMFAYNLNDLPESGAKNALENAIISYLTSGAIRLGLQENHSFSDVNCLYDAHTMIVHDDRQTDQHKIFAYLIKEIIEGGARPPSNWKMQNLPPNNRIDTSLAKIWANSRKAVFEEWYNYYHLRRQDIMNDPSGPAQRTGTFPSFSDVMNNHLLELIDNLKLRVINGKPEWKEDRKYGWETTIDSTGVILPPADIATIFVGGDILGRGLTFNNLATSFFLRSARIPQQSTTMQRQRWLGYRGKIWEYVTLHSSPEILNELRTDHWAEEQILRTLHHQIRNGFTPRITPLVALNKAGRGRAAGQVKSLVHLRYSKTPFLKFVEPNSTDNIVIADDILTELSTSGYSTSWASPGNAGLVSTGTVSAVKIAEWLDSLRYSWHGPPDLTNAKEEYAVYKGLENMLNLAPGDLVIDPAAGGFAATVPKMPPTIDPYLISAYLKLWNLISNGGQTAKAKILGNAGYRMDTVPRFKVGLAYGSENKPLGGLTIDPMGLLPSKNDWCVKRRILPNYELSSTWRGTSQTYPGGDRFIDFDPSLESWFMPGTGFSRPRGYNIDGLLVLHILNDGTDTLPPTISLGLSIPDGGPSAGFAW